MMFVKTCLGCNGQRIRFLERTEEEMTVRRVGNRVTMRMPLPGLCLDCGSTASNYQPLRQP